MEIKIKYSREEIGKIVMAHHIKVFGSAPDGEEWHCDGDYYSGWNVENIKIPKKKPIPEPTEPEPPKPEAPEEGI